MFGVGTLGRKLDPNVWSAWQGGILTDECVDIVQPPTIHMVFWGSLLVTQECLMHGFISPFLSIRQGQ